MVFISQFDNVVYHIDLFANIEESLHPCNKAYLVMTYDLFNMLLDSVLFYIYFTLLVLCLSVQFGPVQSLSRVQLFATPSIAACSLLQHHSSKASILWHSAFFTVQLSHPYMSLLDD